MSSSTMTDKHLAVSNPVEAPTFQRKILYSCPPAEGEERPVFSDWFNAVPPEDPTVREGQYFWMKGMPLEADYFENGEFDDYLDACSAEASILDAPEGGDPWCLTLEGFEDFGDTESEYSSDEIEGPNGLPSLDLEDDLESVDEGLYPVGLLPTDSVVSESNWELFMPPLLPPLPLQTRSPSLVSLDSLDVIDFAVPNIMDPSWSSDLSMPPMLPDLASWADEVTPLPTPVLAESPEVAEVALAPALVNSTQDCQQEQNVHSFSASENNVNDDDFDDVPSLVDLNSADLRLNAQVNSEQNVLPIGYPNCMALAPAVPNGSTAVMPMAPMNQNMMGMPQPQILGGHQSNPQYTFLDYGANKVMVCNTPVRIDTTLVDKQYIMQMTYNCIILHGNGTFTQDFCYQHCAFPAYPTSSNFAEDNVQKPVNPQAWTNTVVTV